jgi:NDP-sugar pyrophosphorylase family protein
MMQILIPMAGAGSRFRSAGFQVPKPLIDVAGKPMISRVIDNLGARNNFVFVVQKEQYQTHKFLFDQAVSQAQSARFEFVNGLTRGAAETAVLACRDLNLNQDLMIANCDQIMDWSADHFAEWWHSTESDGSIVTFWDNSIKNSYVRIDHEGWVVESKEKEVISNLATTGVYVWRTAQKFVDAATVMIERNIRTNNEFYVAPVFNLNIAREHKINVYHVNRHWPIGTPEDLDIYLNHLAQFDQMKGSLS